MKTLQSLFSFIFCFVIALIVLSCTVISFYSALQEYVNVETNRQVSITIPFVLTGIVLLALFFFVLLQSFNFLKKYLTYYRAYQERKRDFLIEQSIKEDSYGKLMLEIRKASTVEEKERLYREFKEKDNVKVAYAKDFADAIKQMVRKNN